MTQQWNSLGNGLRSGGSTNLKNLPFTLYLMQAATGFSNDGQGTTQYIDTCKQNGLLPVGCGTFTYNCDKHRYNDALQSGCNPKGWTVYCENDDLFHRPHVHTWATLEILQSCPLRLIASSSFPIRGCLPVSSVPVAGHLNQFGQI